MTKNEAFAIWGALDYSEYNTQREKAWVVAYIDWLWFRKIEDESGVVKTDDWTTILERLLMHDTLGSWANNEYGADELFGWDGIELMNVLLAAIPAEVRESQKDDVHVWAVEWVRWNNEGEILRCAISPYELPRAVWVAALSYHLETRSKQTPKAPESALSASIVDSLRATLFGEFIAAN